MQSVFLAIHPSFSRFWDAGITMLVRRSGHWSGKMMVEGEGKGCSKAVSPCLPSPAQPALSPEIFLSA
jgi:hypothetical protein